MNNVKIDDNINRVTIKKINSIYAVHAEATGIDPWFSIVEVISSTNYMTTYVNKFPKVKDIILHIDKNTNYLDISAYNCTLNMEPLGEEHENLY